MWIFRRENFFRFIIKEMKFTYFIKFFPGFFNEGPDIRRPPGQHYITNAGYKCLPKQMGAQAVLVHQRFGLRLKRINDVGAKSHREAEYNQEQYFNLQGCSAETLNY